MNDIFLFFIFVCLCDELYSICISAPVGFIDKISTMNINLPLLVKERQVISFCSLTEARLWIGDP